MAGELPGELPGQASQTGPLPGGGGAPDESQRLVLESIQNIQTFIAAQKEKGNPKADMMGKSLLGLIQSIAGGAPDESQAPQETVPPPLPVPAGSADIGARPENAGPGSRPVGPQSL